MSQRCVRGSLLPVQVEMVNPTLSVASYQVIGSLNYLDVFFEGIVSWMRICSALCHENRKKKHWYGDADCRCVTPNSWAGCTVECQEMQPLRNSHPLTIFLRIKENRQFPSALHGCFSGFMQPPLFIYLFISMLVLTVVFIVVKCRERTNVLRLLSQGSTDSIKSSAFVWFWLKIKSNLWKEKDYLCYLDRDPDEESSFFLG